MKPEITLYACSTPNGFKPAVMLEELGVAYNYKKINIMKGDQFSEEFIAINPNSKIPAIVDHSAGDFNVFESGAILIYLAEKYGQFLPTDSLKRSEIIQWVFFQNAGIGPMFGQFGHFYAHEGKDSCDHPYPLERYQNESKRLLGVLEEHLKDNSYLAGGNYSIADIATFPWVGCLDWGYQATEALSLKSFPHVMAWHQKCSERPAAKRGAEVCPF
jgi:glutathione S-transferase